MQIEDTTAGNEKFLILGQVNLNFRNLKISKFTYTYTTVQRNLGEN